MMLLLLIVTLFAPPTYTPKPWLFCTVTLFIDRPDTLLCTSRPLPMLFASVVFSRRTCSVVPCVAGSMSMPDCGAAPLEPVKLLLTTYTCTAGRIDRPWRRLL